MDRPPQRSFRILESLEYLQCAVTQCAPRALRRRGHRQVSLCNALNAQWSVREMICQHLLRTLL